jgi:hypothetical protein
MTIHVKNPDGSAKCGCNVFYHYEYDDAGNVTKKEKRISSRAWVYFETDGRPATCKRCLNKIQKPVTAAIPDCWESLVFHYSFGYDMIINVYARPIRRTAAGLVCQVCDTAIASGEPFSPGGTGRAVAGAIKEGEKPFLMTRKAKENYTYWTGKGSHWSEWDGKPNYENHVD